MNTSRIIFSSLALLALASLLFAQNQQSGLPWYPYWDGKVTRWSSGSELRKQLGVVNGAQGPQGIPGPAGPVGPQGPGLQAVPCVSPDGAARLMVRLPNLECLAAEIVVVGANPNAVPPVARLGAPVPQENIWAQCLSGWTVGVLTPTGEEPIWVCGEDRRWRRLAFSGDKPAFFF